MDIIDSIILGRALDVIGKDVNTLGCIAKTAKGSIGEEVKREILCHFLFDSILCNNESDDCLEYILKIISAVIYNDVDVSIVARKHNRTTAMMNIIKAILNNTIIHKDILEYILAYRYLTSKNSGFIDANSLVDVSNTYKKINDNIDEFVSSHLDEFIRECGIAYVDMYGKRILSGVLCECYEVAKTAKHNHIIWIEREFTEIGFLRCVSLSHNKSKVLKNIITNLNITTNLPRGQVNDKIFQSINQSYPKMTYILNLPILTYLVKALEDRGMNVFISERLRTYYNNEFKYDPFTGWLKICW